MGKIEKMNSLTDWERELALLENKSNLRKLPVIRHLGREVEVNGKVMLNLSSNDIWDWLLICHYVRNSCKVLLPTLFFLPLHPLGC